MPPPTDASVYASRNTSRCPQQDSRSGWIRYFLSCRALVSPTTCRFIPALSVLPVIRPESVPSARSLPTSLLYRDFGFVLAHAIWRTTDCDALSRVVGATGTVAEW